MRLRAVWQVAFGWAFSLGCALVGIVGALVTLGRAAPRFTPWLCRVWGRTMLRAVGVRLEVEGAEHLAGRESRVVTFNHASILDAYVVTALMPEGGTAAVKRELLFYPLIGQAVWLLGFLIIDRAHGQRARATLSHAIRRLQRERLSVLIAPEGTRARSDALLPFKRGAIHLARNAHVPLVPLVIAGARALQPRGQWWTRPGTVRVRILPPVPWTELAVGAPAKAAERLRARYLEEREQLQNAPRIDPPSSPPRPHDPPSIQPHS